MHRINMGKRKTGLGLCRWGGFMQQAYLMSQRVNITYKAIVAYRLSYWEARMKNI